ncbi:hypothetical protein BABINDRAFT_160511 [Babjeviella inositovora NRRL Y-12698]|uniref:Aminotransferase class I/classII large domain-containing protein n=1 Tax=Babjeviella inositovora NRRL Y-12698 TaxID=984486 RepID=A0A1E3QTU0_9ASCO|nr:uncharacterized protein BABINDRAFT_160511 [Babjeviella inositovora NRRL Y-12698]ODQ81105.1 hypothetical protein BABINDRAFT_160511 [Babjeviella inositovora NRRL Y-12698]
MFAGVRQFNHWVDVQMAPPDKILGLSELYVKDPNPKKVNLGVGAYRDEEGKPWILPSVKEAERKLVVEGLEKDKEYVPILGSGPYNSAVQKFIFGHDEFGKKLIAEKRIVSAQTISGTGSLRVIAELLNKFYSVKKCYMSAPTWPNHLNVFRDAGVEPAAYPYYDLDTNSLDIENLLATLNKAEKGALILLHSSCHNPTGLDATSEQWDQILEVITKRELFPIVDMAYQGFATGDPIKDLGIVIHKMTKMHYENPEKLPSFALCQSFAKNMGLYGERTGSVFLVHESPEFISKITSQLKALVRPMYSSPPCHGSKIVEVILNDEKLYKSWLGDVAKITNRLNEVRSGLYDNLDHSLRNWDHLKRQKGMFSYTGLSKDEMLKLRSDFSIYGTDDGRFSLAGISNRNVKYVAEAVNAVVKK